MVATNQSGLGRGTFDMATLNAMHTKMNQLLAKQGGHIDLRNLGRESEVFSVMMRCTITHCW